MKEEIICAGFGGQGIMLLGKLVAFGAMENALHTTWMPSYGAEVRGGTAHSMAIISDDEIASPLVSLCDTAIIMNKPSLDKFLSKIKPKGLLILNSSLAGENVKRKDITVLKIAMTQTARRLGDVRIANIIALGAYITAKKLFLKGAIIKGIKMAFPGSNELINLNIRALEEGLNSRHCEAKPKQSRKKGQGL